MDPLEIGVIGSVLGGSILLLAQWFWRSPLSSIVLRFQKNEPRIAGKWRTTFKEEGQEYHESVTLRQHGRNIMADIILREDNNDETVYKFVGTFRNLVLSGTYHLNYAQIRRSHRRWSWGGSGSRINSVI